VHPTEIAFDIASAAARARAVKHHKRFGFNYDPSHLGYQGVDYVKFIRAFGDRIYHAHMKDVWWGHGDGTVGVFGGHTSFGESPPLLGLPLPRPRRHQVRGHHRRPQRRRLCGPLSVEWEDIRMDRVHGATEAAAFVRKLDFPSSAIASTRSSTRKSSE
jgi:hypothetical protein